MAHFAKVENGLVISVLVVPDEHEADGDAYLAGLGLGSGWVQTSYNTYGGVHANGGVPLRYNYAGVGFTYDADADAFVPPQPEPKPDGVWTLNQTTMLWDWTPDGDV